MGTAQILWSFQNYLRVKSKQNLSPSGPLAANRSSVALLLLGLVTLAIAAFIAYSDMEISGK
jgi:hypothetical protein